LMGSVAEAGTTVLLSSHLLADLERVCDYLIVLNAAQVQLVGTVEDLVAGHRWLTGARHGGEAIAGVTTVVRASHTDRQSTLLVRLFWGAPLVAREVEQGTHRLVWVQGVSRRHWAVVKFGTVAAFTTVAACLYGLGVAWWLAPLTQVGRQSRLNAFLFDMQDL